MNRPDKPAFLRTGLMASPVAARTPGEFQGRKYGTASHTSTLSFMKP